MNNDIVSLKLKHGRIFKATAPLSHMDIYFKLISKGEYDNYLRLAPNRDIISIAAEEFIFSIAVVYPDPNILEKTLWAGEYHAIAEAIASMSGFHELAHFSKELKARRLESQALSEQIIGTIAKAFPIYKISDLDAMNYQEIARLLALSEAMLEIRLEIPGAEIPEPKQPDDRGPQNNSSQHPIISSSSPAALSANEQAIVERQRMNALEALKTSRQNRLF